MKDAASYLHEAGMSARPEYYSGRGPQPGDLGVRQLDKILGYMKRDGGDEAAEAFVAMVAGIKSAAATTFMLGLYALESQGWKGEPPRIKREFDIGHSTSDPEQVRANAEATICAVLGRGLGPERDPAADDFACRGAFLLANGYTFDNGKRGGWRKLKDGERPTRPRVASKHNYDSPYGE